MKKVIFFDVDGVLIDADKIREAKYIELAKEMVKLSTDPEYGGSSWIFKKLKEYYDIGVMIDPKLYKLVDENIPSILEALKEKYILIACSKAGIEVNKAKFKATGIDKYFDKIITKPIPDTYEDFIVVDDRFTEEFCDRSKAYVVKFNNGQHKGLSSDYDAVIDNLGELIEIL